MMNLSSVMVQGMQIHFFWTKYFVLYNSKYPIYSNVAVRVSISAKYVFVFLNKCLLQNICELRKALEEKMKEKNYCF